jgi:hypothetical protein
MEQEEVTENREGLFAIDDLDWDWHVDSLPVLRAVLY